MRYALRLINLSLLILIHLIQPTYLYGLVDLSKWTQESDITNAGSWNLQTNLEPNDRLLQTINGKTTYYVSDVDLINGTMKGYFLVRSEGEDDDMIGFVFGFKSTQETIRIRWCATHKGNNRGG